LDQKASFRRDSGRSIAPAAEAPQNCRARGELATDILMSSGNYGKEQMIQREDGADPFDADNMKRHLNARSRKEIRFRLGKTPGRAVATRK